MAENGRQKYIIGAMLIFAALVITTGLKYGLPLWLIDDEPPFILAALKMIQLKIIIPVFHMAEFKSILYYPPYLAYLYLPLFVVIAGVKFLVFGGGAQQFADYIARDPSVFFMAARSVMLVASLATIYLIYLVVGRIFTGKWAAIASVFFMSTSVSYLALSMTSRHWLPVAFMGAMTLFLLTYPGWSFRKRYGLAAVLLGMGFGVSIISVIYVLLLPLWYLFYERKSLRGAVIDPFIYGLIFVFIILALVPVIIFPASFGFSGGIFDGVKNLWDFIASPLVFLRPLALVDPILMFWAVIGIVVAFFRRERFALPLMFFVVLYGGIFYIFFYLTHRFTVPLIPILALFAGYAVAVVWETRTQFFVRVMVVVTMIIPVAATLQLARLTYKNDARAMARAWVESNIPAGSKIAVLSPRLRLASQRESIEEQRRIDPNSLRRVDEAEAAIGSDEIVQTFHALNLYTVQNKNFFDNLPKYLREHNYEYLILTEDEYSTQAIALSSLLRKSEILAAFGNERGIRAPGAEVFRWSLWDLFRTNEFGPETVIYKLKF